MIRKWAIHLSGFLCLLTLCSEGKADTIWFTGGAVYMRNLEMDHAGSSGEPLVITSTGTKKAVISAGAGFGLRLSNCRNVEILNLEFRGDGRLTGNKENGVIIEDCEDIRISDLEIHGFQHSGLLVNGSADGIRIEEVFAHDNGFAGIHVFGEYPDKNQSRNIYIGHCTAENNPGDPTVTDNHSGNGIIVGSCDSVLIEYCVATENGWDMPRKGNGPVGIWAWNADHVTIQHCISHHNKTSPQGHDGGGFDLDGGVTNSVIQYCLSYENEGPGIGLFEYVGADLWNKNTIRYNISINDGSKNGNTSLAVWNGQKDPVMLSTGWIHNNFFYNDRENGRAVVYWDRYSEGLHFANNIFLTDGPAIAGPYDQSDFSGNVYWNLGKEFELSGFTSLEGWASATGQEMAGDQLTGLNTDPLLHDPGPVTITDPDSMNAITLAGFLLQSSSPLIDRGLDLKEMFGIDPGPSDFFGHLIPQGSALDRGVHEFSKETGSGVYRFSGAGDWIQICRDPAGSGGFHIRIEPVEGVDAIHFRITELGGRLMQSGVAEVTGHWQHFQLPGNRKTGMYLFHARASGKMPVSKIILLQE